MNATVGLRCLFFALLVLCFTGPSALAIDEDVRIALDQALPIRLSEPAEGVAIGNPAIAGVSVQTDTFLFVTGRSLGSTNLTVVGQNGRVIYATRIVVTPDEIDEVITERSGETVRLECTPLCRPRPDLAAGDIGQTAAPQQVVQGEPQEDLEQEAGDAAAPWIERQSLGTPYEVNGRWYVPTPEPGYEQTGVASWYGPQFQGHRTASGETFDQDELTAAHPTLPIPSLAQVTNLDKGREVIVRVNDRGPFSGDRLIELSRAAANVLGFEQAGQARVSVRYLGPAPRRIGADRADDTPTTAGDDE